MCLQLEAHGLRSLGHFLPLYPCIEGAEPPLQQPLTGGHHPCWGTPMSLAIPRRISHCKPTGISFSRCSHIEAAADTEPASKATPSEMLMLLAGMFFDQLPRLSQQPLVSSLHLPLEWSPDVCKQKHLLSQPRGPTRTNSYCARGCHDA